MGKVFCNCCPDLKFSVLVKTHATVPGIDSGWPVTN